MVPKRPFHDEGLNGTGFPAQEAKRFKNPVKDVLGLLSLNDVVAKMEPFLRDVVRDEVEKTVRRCLQSSSRASCNQAGTSGRRGLLLRFDNKLPSTIFTGGKIEAEDGSPIKIMLLDANTGNLIASGALSSMKIEILALDGDFGSDDMENWSENEFTANVIREREGRRPLITGELSVTLKNGVGQLGEISFTDNSSWQRSRKFRLGARPVQKTSGVREARSDAFVVKDHRGELYKKHYPPALKDEVWRLDRIAKEGAFHKRLASHGIHCVGDFLQLHFRDPSALREVLGGGISNRIWDTIVGHAATCRVDDDKFFSFYDAEQRVGLLFDSVHRVVGAMFDGLNYQRLDSLSPPQKALVENIKRKAYKNLHSFILVDANSVPRPLTTPQPGQFHSTNLAVQQLGFPVAGQGQQEMQLDFSNSPGSTSYTCDGDTISNLGVSIAQNTHPKQVFSSPALRQSFKIMDNLCFPYIGESSWPASSSQWPIVTSGLLTTEDNSELGTSAWPHTMQTWSPGNTFIITSNNEVDLGFFTSHQPSFTSGIRSPRAGWCKLRAALNLGSVRKEAAARRLWQSSVLGNQKFNSRQVIADSILGRS